MQGERGSQCPLGVRYMVVGDTGNVGQTAMTGFGANQMGRKARFCSFWSSATPVLNCFSGIVQGVLHPGRGYNILGCLKHFQHIGLGVTASDIWALYTSIMVCILHTIKAAVDTL